MQEVMHDPLVAADGFTNHHPSPIQVFEKASMRFGKVICGQKLFHLFYQSSSSIVVSFFLTLLFSPV